MIIELRESGSSLGTRLFGAKLRSKIEQSIKDGNKITLNFEGVDVVSNSFADECFGKLLFSFELSVIKKNIVIRNANDFIKHVIKIALSERLSLIVS